MIDVISGEEPPIELGDEPSRNFGVPHPGWFLATVVLQLVVLFFIGASKLHAMPPATIIRVKALTDYVSHDKFRGNYIRDVIFNADAEGVLPSTQAKEIALIFGTNKQDSALDPSIEKWKFVRLDPTFKRGCKSMRPSEVALRAKVSPSSLQSDKQMIFIDTAPFFISEEAANSLGLRASSHLSAEFELAVDKDGNASIVSVDTAHWLSANRSN